MRTLLFLKFLFIVCGSSILFAKPPANYIQAKSLAIALFSTHQETLYCGCKFDNEKRIDLASCGMEQAIKYKRARRLEWEHMMPAENFGRHFKCWREPLCVNKYGKRYKGRKCCQRIDKNFQQAEGELYNLWPSVGLVNQTRSNYRFSPLTKNRGFFGCAIEIDKSLRKVDPPNRAKGIVARANLFMSERYNIRLSSAQRKLFEAWNKTFPPSEWEKRWAASVAKIEGYHNPYIH